MISVLAVLLLTAVLATAAPVSVSGIYPSLAMYNREGECGTGAVVPWAGKLWVITYGPHLPKGSSDKLYCIDDGLVQSVHPLSTGGTPANRMIHRESQQLFIGPYAIDKSGDVRVIPYGAMPGRHTGNARHLTDPANKIYYATMEEGLYEVDVHTLAVKEHIVDGNSRTGVQPGSVHSKLPGYHGKGLYSGQGRVVYANNGDRGKGAHTDPTTASGALGQWFGKGDWQLVRRNQFTEVTGPGGIYGNANPDTDPVWAVGWDYRSLILMLLENGKWHAYRLPKSSHSYDGAHGWNTEWPRIRDIGEDDLLMTMHGCFWHFPKTFRRTTSAGIRPRSNYLKVIGDVCRWHDRVVLGCDDSAQKEFLNHRSIKSKYGAPGQSNSNLWFIEPGRLDQLGPVIGRGSVWLRDDVEAGTESDPFLFAGYDHRLVHISHGTSTAVTFVLEVDRDGHDTWSELTRVTVPAGESRFRIFTEDEAGAWIRLRPEQAAKEVTVHFSYRNRDTRATVPSSIFTGLSATGAPQAIGGIMRCLGSDKRTLGLIATAPEAGSTGVYYELDADLKLHRKDDDHEGRAFVTAAVAPNAVYSVDAASAVFTEDGKRYRIPACPAFPDPGPSETQTRPLPPNLALNATVTVSSSHGTSRGPNAVDGKATDASRWVSPATGEKWIALDLGRERAIAAARIVSGFEKKASTAVRNLRLQVKRGDSWEDIPGGSIADNVATVLALNFTAPVTAQHIRMLSDDPTHVRIYELELFATPLHIPSPAESLRVARVCREVATERDLLNCQGTFYELPARNAQGFAKIRPVATHSFAIHDYCSYRGLLLMTGLDPSALSSTSDHIIVSDDGKAAVWAGAIDDLWQLGKPVGKGGPWKDTAVAADTPSDPYLMTAYDRKTVTFSHNANETVTFRIEVDVDGTGLWVPYKTFAVAPGQTVEHRFPDGFSAYWVRTVADRACAATAWFTYE